MKYLAYARAEFLRGFQYRANYWATVAGTAIGLLIQWFLWHAVYQGGATTIAGLTLGTMLSYSLMGRVISCLLKEPVGTNLGPRVRAGTIVHDLVKPVSFHTVLLFQTFGRAAYGLISTGGPCFVVLLVTGLIRLPSPETIFAFTVSLGMAYVTLFSTYFVSGILTFYTKTGVGVEHIYSVISLLSGGFVPLEFFPGWLRTIADHLPFKGIYYVPMALWSGITPPDQALPSLLTQGIWTLAMVAVSRLIWSGAVKSLTVQGG